MGMGEPQAHGLGLFSHSAVSVERHPGALGLAGPRGDLYLTVWLGICHVARRVDCRAPGLWTDRARETRLCRHSDATSATRRPLRCMADLQLPSVITRPQSCGWIPRSPLDRRI